MKKALAWVLVLALTAALAVGGTLAYLTDTDEDVNVMTIGKVKIDQLEFERIDTETTDDDATVQEFHDNKPLYPAVTENGFDYTPGDSYVDWEQIGKEDYTSDIWDPSKINNEVDKMVFVKNKGDYDAYVRSVFAFEAGNYETLAEFKEMVHLNLNDTDWTWEWVETPVTIGESTYFVATATYNKVLEPGALTEISLSQIALDSSATNEDVEAFGETYQVLVKTQAIQADGFDNAADALDEGFGEISTENIPWTSDSPIQGIDLRTALHYYEGDQSNQITTKVTNVVFGLNKEYTDIVNNYTGTLVDVEQDVPVYAYYVPNGSNYDVYFLANDTIYLPKDATKLFNGMSKLTTMEVDNLSTERTTSLKGTFQGCNKLKELDVTNWNVSNVTDMIAAFNWCYELKLIGYENWDTSKVTNMAMLFQSNRAATELDLSNWDMSSVTTIASMFQDCTNLTNVDTTGWDTGSVTSLNQMFLDCKKLTEIKGIADWDTADVSNFAMVFYGCKAMDNVDVSKWDTGKGTLFNSMFAYSPKLNLDREALKNWDMGSAVRINHMFYDCRAQEELDLSGWDMPNMITTTHMFSDCTSLRSIDFTGWNTPSLVSMDCMFNDCDDLTYLDVSSFDTANCHEFSQLFERCSRLETIVGLDQWDTRNARTYEEMFYGCAALKEVDMSTFYTRDVVNDYVMEWKGTGWGFLRMFSGVNSLEKMTLSADFSFDGDGKVTTESYKVSLPNPAAKEGYIAKWRNVETGEIYLASEIPEETAATYEAYYEPIANP